MKAKKLLPQSEPANFIGVEGDQRLIRVYVPTTNKIRRVRRADFHRNKSTPLPSVSALLDGIYRQRIIEEETNEDTEDQTEEVLQSTLASLELNKTLTMTPAFSLTSRFTPHKTYLGVIDGPPLPTSFAFACFSTERAAAIDSEYNFLLRRGTWKYIKFDANITPVPFKSTFRSKT